MITTKIKIKRISVRAWLSFRQAPILGQACEAITEICTARLIFLTSTEGPVTGYAKTLWRAKFWRIGWVNSFCVQCTIGTLSPCGIMLVKRKCAIEKSGILMALLDWGRPFGRKGDNNWSFHDTHVMMMMMMSRLGNLGFCSRFCVECACSMRKVQGSSPNGGTKYFAVLWLKIFFHSLEMREKVKNDEKRTNHEKLLSTHWDLNPGPLTLVGALSKGHY